MMDHEGTGRSRAGRDFAANEDSFLADDTLGLYVVGDGDGRATAGEVASRIAVEAVASYIETHRVGLAGMDLFANALATRAVQYAFGAVHQARASADVFRDMDTTLSLLLIRKARAVVGHVGDSRVYLVRNGELHQLTVDHPWTEQTEGRPQLAESLDVDTFRLDIEPNDTFLLCTDGTNAAMADAGWVVGVTQDVDLGRIARKLVDRARSLGEGNDATIVVVRMRDDEEKSRFFHFFTADAELFHAVPLAA